MTNVPMTIACRNYDRTRAIRDGTVKVEGCASLICRSIRKRFSTAPSSSRNSISRNCRSRATSARWRGHFGLYRIPALCRGSSANPDLIRNDAASKSCTNCAASASAAGISDHRGGRARADAARYGVTQPRCIGAAAPGAAGAHERMPLKHWASICRRSATTERWPACRAGELTRCSRRGRRRRSSTASRISRGCFPIGARPSRLTIRRSRRPRMHSSASAKRLRRNIRGCTSVE